MLAPAVLKQLTRELQELATSEDIASLGIRVKINEVDITDISAELDGPPGTPYAGGVFAMRLSLPPDFPVSPPRGYFLTKIYHPNVSKAGEICVNVLKRDWKPDLGRCPFRHTRPGIKHVLAVVRCLLIEPYPESALNEEAGRALLEDYAAYAQHAALMTSLHAAKRGGPLTGSAAANVSGGCGGGGSSPGSKRTRPADARPAAAGAAPGVSAGTTTAAAAKAKKSLKRL